MIGYRGRLWFANSVKWEDHNSADLYSYDPGKGTVRYEAHLFSQDAGDPTIHRGLLYWPSEDPRWSMGRGEFMATNGRDWRWGFLPQMRAFHIHAMASHDGALYAATSAWRAGLQRSRDGGESWTVLHRHTNPVRQISRIVALTSHKGALYAGLFARYRVAPSLLRLEGGKLAPVAGWPGGHGALPLTSWRGHLYASNAAPAGRSLWRTDGVQHERITAPNGYFVRDIAGGAGALWAITVHRGGGSLWRSGNGRAWIRIQEFKGARPVDVAVFAGRVYVGTIGPAKRGGLWGPKPPASPRVATPRSLNLAPMPPRKRHPLGRPISAVLADLDRLMADAKTYRNHARPIQAILRDLAATRSLAVGRALATRLKRTYPTALQSMFGGRSKVPTDRMARWYLMWAVVMNGNGVIPRKLLTAPWTARPNGAQKYLSPPPGAAWAMARLGQRDPMTITALIGRLGRPGDPPWLDGDIVGALTMLTGRRFGYDRVRWRRWWAAQAR
ncbi:MAG TPA: hypothetical protein VM325_19420 [Alphaproteobacteria bacterium]|nr:hypothetical protein [Alphaproteobacteria bacterium]